MKFWSLVLIILSMSLCIGSAYYLYNSWKLKSRIKIQFYLFTLLFSVVHILLFLVRDQFKIIPTPLENFSSLMFSVVILTIPPIINNYVRITSDSTIKIDLRTFRVSYILTSINVISFVYFTLKPKADEFLYEVIENVMNYSNFIAFLFIIPSISIYFLRKIILEIRKTSNSNIQLTWTGRNNYQFVAVGYFVFITCYLITKYLDHYVLFAIFQLIIITYYFIIIVQFKIFINEPVNEIKEITNVYSNQKYYDEIDEKLKKIMLTELPFLDSKITVYQLAKMIDTNEKYLSNYLNEVHNLNFYNYINQFRISQAKELLVDPLHENYTIETIGNMSGFNSKSSFNSAFKKETGLTPSEYKKSKYQKDI